MLPLTDVDNAVLQRLAGELAEVESRFAAELVSELPFVNDLVRHIERYRGKMFRPTLLLLSGLAVAPDQELLDDHRTLAAVAEMVHMATLVHDDVLDESEVRRKGATINHLQGNEAAVMLGDYLISHAYHLCSSIGSPSIARLASRATNIVCEGELLQLANRNNWSLDEQTYFQIITRKTGTLCAVSSQLGALVAGADRDLCEAMRRFGQNVGIAFQIADDVLDLVGDERIVGKSLGKDLEKSKLTLPLIHRLETAAAAPRQQLLDVLRSPGPDQAPQIRRLLADTDSIAYARRRAEQYLSRAIATAQVLPDSPPRQALLSLTDSIVNRRY